MSPRGIPNPSRAWLDCKDPRCGLPHPRGCHGHAAVRDENGRHIGYRACSSSPLRGSTVCKYHGGTASQTVAKVKRDAERAALQKAIDRYGIPLEVDGAEALISLVWEAAGNVEFLRQLVQALPTHPTIERDEENHVSVSAGIYGPTFHQTGVPTGEAKPNVLVVMYNEERDRLARYARDALSAGVEERRVKLAERDATALFRAVSTTLARMELVDRFEEFRAHFADALRTPEPDAVGAG